MNLTATYCEISFTDDDVVNPEEYNQYNPHYKIRPFLIYEYGATLAVVFAHNEGEAFDIAVDEGKLDSFRIDPSNESDREDYMVKDAVTPGFDEKCPEYVDKDGNKWWWKEGREPDFLGNAGEPFDLDNVSIMELPNPPFSFVALFSAAQERCKNG